jgi:hypothetical protein
MAAIQFIDMMFFENNYWGDGGIWEIFPPTWNIWLILIKNGVIKNGFPIYYLKI